MPLKIYNYNEMKNPVSILIPVLLVFLLQACHTVPEQFAASDKYRLVWTSDPSTTITIAWDQADSVSNPVVYFGETDNGREYWKYSGQQSAQRILKKYEMNTHFAGLSNLKGNTAYYFVIKDDYGVSKRFWFKTAPDTPQPFTFIAGGDTKSFDEPLEAGRNSNRIVAKLRPLFVYYNGDFTTGNGTDPASWEKWLNDWLELTTTTDGRMIPIVPIHGNHENGDLANLNYIFNTPYQENDSSKIYYSLSLGGDFFHMIQLNSEIEEGGAQRDWLEDNLKKHSSYTFKIAAYHKPFFPHYSGKSENWNQYRQWAFLFNQYKLSVSFDADSHMHKVTYPVVPDSTENGFMGFVRDDKNGTIYTGEGSWGAAPRANDDDKPWTLVSGSCNQVNWIHVVPKTDAEEAHMKIYTVISATYTESDSLILHNREFEPLTEQNWLEEPKNIEFHKTNTSKPYVRYPFNAD
jgi:hypothetical protein